MNYHKYIGHWKNTNSKSKGIACFDFFEKDNELWIKLEGVANGMIPGAWKPLPCKIYAASTDSKEPVAFQANYSCDAFDAYCQINLNKSLIIIGLLLDYKNDDSKSGVYKREFYSLRK